MHASWSAIRRAHDYLGFRTTTDLVTGIATTLRALDEALV
jgi:hypothetical protein